MSAIENSDLKGVQIAIRQGADPNIAPKGENRPITVAIATFGFTKEAPEREKARGIISYLFSKGARLSGHKDELFMAIFSNDKLLMSTLLDRGLDPHSKLDGYSSIELAYLRKSDGLIPLLRSRNVPDIQPEDQQVMRIMRALTWLDHEALKKLIDEKVDLNQYDPRGRTPLLEALSSSSWIMVPECFLQILLGAPNFNLQSRWEGDYGMYPLHRLAATLTIESKYADSVAGLILVVVHRHADPNVKDKFDETPLHYAARGNFPQITQALLMAGANPLAVNFRGQRPSSQAKNSEIRSMLLKAEKSAIEAQ
ncbi:MAG: ankyrin repeat domain-containing protein [Holophagaceae bacterium]|nr:ankyrin repeat domain-containing protein [Holophagaceae bacterium]